MKLKLSEKKPETSDVTSFLFDSSEPLTWQAGQFLHYKLDHPNPDNRGINRFFSISSAPHEGKVRLTTRFTLDKGSSFKNTLKDLPIGTEIETTQPSGDFTLNNPDPNQRYVFIAGGIGITPLRSILMELAHQNLPMNINLLYASRSQEIPFKAELDKIVQQHPPFSIHYIIDPERIDEAKIRELVPNFQEVVFYVSGPEPMVESLGNQLREMGVAEDHIKQDFFPGYEHP